MSGRETHGHTKGRRTTPEFRSWCAMLQRCYYKKSVKYPRYGGRGIQVCERWRTSFEAFIEDMGPAPPNTSIERRENNRNYEPDNCHWGTTLEQANNRSNNRLVTFHDETHTVAEWARKIGVSYTCLQSRLDRNWPIALAFDPTMTRQGSQKIQLQAAKQAEISEKHKEILVCVICATPFPRKTIRSRTCSGVCQKKQAKKESYARNKDRINLQRRTKVLSNRQVTT